MKALVNARFQTQPFADVISGRQRQNRSREKGGIAESESKEGAGRMPGEWRQGHGGVSRIIDLPVAANVNGRCAGYDDEEGHHVRDDAAHDDIPAGIDVFLHLDALLDHRRLKIELHPGRDGRADYPSEHVEVAGTELKGGL